jgi:hypothetical protein
METMAMVTATTLAMTMATRWQATEWVTASAARAMMSAKKRAMVMVARLMVMATKRARAARAKATATRVSVEGRQR